ncbi:hypothetical protein [Dyella sp. C11]|uniref:hypothetical protein n=1 Tax=Dyella sp. C11 TaxID=2126991 RepID=UPI000D657E2A|nr:hypothetical protein [Dyella sp. C11]
MDWLTDIKNWLISIIQQVWDAISGFYHDLSLKIVKGFLDAIAELAKNIPVPQWMSDYSLGHLFGQLSPTLGYFVDRLGIGAGLALLGLGYTFRVTRKLLTAFQW